MNAQSTATFAEDLKADQREKARQLHSRRLEADIKAFEAWQSNASQRVIFFFYRASFHIDLFAGNGTRGEL